LQKANRRLPDEGLSQRLEDLTSELFRLHDLDGNGLLEEPELILLNQQIALRHYGKGADLVQVRTRYRELFRANLDPDGRPVPYRIFCDYTQKVLDGLDKDPVAQEMILEQWAAEVQACREAFEYLPGTELLVAPPTLAEEDGSPRPLDNLGFVYRRLVSEADLIPIPETCSETDLCERSGADGMDGREYTGVTPTAMEAAEKHEKFNLTLDDTPRQQDMVIDRDRTESSLVDRYDAMDEHRRRVIYPRLQESTSCTSRFPVIGDMVCMNGDLEADHESGRANAWQLLDGQVATVVDVDQDGDIKLRAPSGLVSGWVFREHFDYAKQVSPAEATIHSI